MKKTSITALLILITTLLFAQIPEFEWAKQFEGSSSGTAFDIALDKSGNVYTTGTIAGTFDFDPGAGVYNLNAVDEGIFISKLNANGELEWAKYIGSEYPEGIRSITVDSLERVYITGYIHGTIDVDPGPDSHFLVSSGGSDIFILALDHLGEFLWAKILGNTSGSEWGTDVTVDASNNIYLAGRFSGTIDFDPGVGTFLLSADSGETNVFILKLNELGEFIWAGRLGSLGSTMISGPSIVLDDNANIYVANHAWHASDYDPGPDTFWVEALNDFVITKLNSEGGFLWTKLIEGDGSFSLHKGAIALDLFGNIYTTGSFYGKADFDPGPDTFYLQAPLPLTRNMFVLKLDNNGNFLWARQMGGAGFKTAYGIDVDVYGNVYTTGQFRDTADFDPGPGVYSFEASSPDAFVSKLDASGNFVWAEQLGGGAGVGGSERGYSLQLDRHNNIHTTGHFNGNIDFDPGAGVYNMDGNVDPFIQKLKQCLLAPQMTEDTITQCSGDSSTHLVTASLLDTLATPVYVPATYKWSLFDFTDSISVSPLVSTQYIVTITAENGCTYMDTLEVIVNDVPDLSITGPTEACEEEEISLLAEGGGEYTWSTGEVGNEISTLITSSASYYVTTTDANSCTNTDSINVMSLELPNPFITGILEVCPNDTTTLTVEGGIDYLWNTDNNTKAIEVTPSSNTEYTVTVTNENGCTNIAIATVIMDENQCPPCATLPNAFTPDADGKNDVFRVLSGEGIEVLDFRIYNRWGELVHNSVQPWDGTLEGKPLPMDVYIYVVQVRSHCGREEKRGEVTLIR